jgi:hypothetical protein
MNHAERMSRYLSMLTEVANIYNQNRSAETWFAQAFHSCRDKWPDATLEDFTRVLNAHDSLIHPFPF